jgi:hypothetical protein
MKKLNVPLLWLAVCLGSSWHPYSLQSRRQQRSNDVKVVAAANMFVATLSDAEKAKGTFAFSSSQRTGWSNLPTGAFQRNGPRFGDLAQQKKDAAFGLLAAALSRDGYQKVMNIMNGDEVLKNSNGGQTGGRHGGRVPGQSRGIQFGRDEYYMALLGTPSTNTPWMIQFGGHHLAIGLRSGSNSVTTRNTNY